MALCTTVPQHPAAVSYHTPSSGPSLRPPVTAVTAVAAAYRTTPQPRIYAPPKPALEMPVTAAASYPATRRPSTFIS